MIREPPWLEPRSCAGPNLSSPSTRCPARGEVVGGGAAHAAEPDHDHVVGGSHASVLRGGSRGRRQRRIALHPRVDERLGGDGRRDRVVAEVLDGARRSPGTATSAGSQA